MVTTQPSARAPVFGLEAVDGTMIGLVGGKAANLGELIGAGLPRAAGVLPHDRGLPAGGREYGIPAVVGVPDATSRIATGQQTHVDGTSGVVVPVDDRED